MTERACGYTDIAVFCADIGSISQGNFGWAGLSGGRGHEGTEIAELAEAVAICLTGGQRVALGFEAPLFVPLPVEASMLGKARDGESKAWSAGSGAQVLATALAQVSWLLERVRQRAPTDAVAFLDWPAFLRSRAGLFIWEALVTGKAKTGSHAGDAAVAVRAFRAAIPDLTAHSLVRADRVLSLVGAALLRTGWSCDVSLLSASCAVLGVQ
jgi:hypothetical protein